MSKNNAKQFDWARISGARVITSLFVAAIIWLTPLASQAATLGIIGSGGPLSVGSEYEVLVHIDSEDVGVNAAQATVKFNQSVVSVKSIDKTGSVFNFWLLEPTYDNTSGKIEFIGGSSDGVSGKSLLVLRIVFTVKGAGQTHLTFDDAAVTASDGNGTNVLTVATGLDANSVNKAVFVEAKPILIERKPEVAKALPAKPAISVPLYPDPTAWYSVASNFVARWDIPADVGSVSAVINRTPNTLSTDTEGLYDNKTFRPLLDDGIWYLHVRFKNSVGWGDAVHYRIALDITPPSSLRITNESTAKSQDPRVTFSMNAGDQLSGIEGYYVRIDHGNAVRAEGGKFTTEPLGPGKHAITAIARDNAKNEAHTTSEVEISALPSPVILSIRKDLYAGEGGIPVSGTALPGSLVILSVRNQNGDSVHEAQATTLENGTWSLSIEDPLRFGKYSVDAMVQDAQGGVSEPSALMPIEVKERPFASVFGLSFGYLQTIYGLLWAGTMLVSLTLILWFIYRGMRKRKEQHVEQVIIGGVEMLQKRLSDIINLHISSTRRSADGKVSSAEKLDAESKVDEKLLDLEQEIEKGKSQLIKEIEDIE